MFEFWSGAENLSITGFIIRAFIVYIYIFLIIKILGQRSIGTIHPLDFLFSIIIGDILGEPLASGEVPLAGPIAAATLIAFLHLFLSYIALKAPRFRRVIEDEPIILIKNGQILHKQLKKTKITVESLLMDLRLRDAIDLTEVDYAILETNGQISVIKKSNNQCITPEDLNINLVTKGYPSVFIEDGHIISSNIEKHGKNMSWLKEQLKKNGINTPQEVFLFTMDEGEQIYISKK